MSVSFLQTVQEPTQIRSGVEVLKAGWVAQAIGNVGVVGVNVKKPGSSVGEQSGQVVPTVGEQVRVADWRARSISKSCRVENTFEAGALEQLAQSVRSRVTRAQVDGPISGATQRLDWSKAALFGVAAGVEQDVGVVGQRRQGKVLLAANARFQQAIDERSACGS